MRFLLLTCVALLTRSCFCAAAINAENAAHKSEKFRAMATRTRQEYLKDLATNYVSTTVLDSGSKLSTFLQVYSVGFFSPFVFKEICPRKEKEQLPAVEDLLKMNDSAFGWHLRGGGTRQVKQGTFALSRCFSRVISALDKGQEKFGPFHGVANDSAQQFSHPTTIQRRLSQFARKEIRRKSQFVRKETRRKKMKLTHPLRFQVNFPWEVVGRKNECEFARYQTSTPEVLWCGTYR